MKISVVVPAYNEEYYLPILLRSLEKQTFSLPHEILVVDNNSTDNTVKTAQKYGAKVLLESRRGIAYACDRGFKAATGEIIVRADADYVLPSNWLEKIWKEFRKDKNVIALGGPTFPLESKWWQNIIFYPGTLSWMYLLKLLGKGFLFPNIAVRKEAFYACGGFDTSIAFGEDTNFCLRLTKVGKVKLIPNLYVYTSIRRIYELGLMKFIMGYGIGNQIAPLFGKTPSVGLDAIRTVPSYCATPRTPLPYLIVLPAVASYLLLATVLFAASSSDVPTEEIISNAAQKNWKKVLALKSDFENLSQKINLKITPYLDQY